MQKRILIILVLLMCLCLPAFTFAETIVLKSGKTVEGKLIETTNKYIKIDFHGVPLTYFFDDIESINGNKIISFDASYEEMADTTIKESEELLKNDPDSAVAYNHKGVGYRMQGNQNEAIICFTKAIELNPRYAEAYLNRALSYGSSELKKYDEALSDFDKSIELNPSDNFFAYSGRGSIYFDKGNYDQAISDLSRAIETDHQSETYYRRGLAYVGKGNYDYAISDLNKVIAIDSKNMDAYVSLGLVYVYKEDSDQAISSCNKALGIDPNFGPMYSVRAMAYFLKKEYDKSWSDMHKAESLGCDNPKLLEHLKETSGRQK